MNLTPKKEYVVGIAIGPIQADERNLVSIPDDMIFHGISPRKMIDLLVLDQGYWGREFLTSILSCPDQSSFGSKANPFLPLRFRLANLFLVSGRAFNSISQKNQC